MIKTMGHLYDIKLSYVANDFLRFIVYYNVTLIESLDGFKKKI